MSNSNPEYNPAHLMSPKLVLNTDNEAPMYNGDATVDDDPFWDLEEQECHPCHGTGIENGNLFDPHETPCPHCGGWGSL